MNMVSRTVLALVLISAATARIIKHRSNNYNEYENPKDWNFQEILASQLKERLPVFTPPNQEEVYHLKNNENILPINHEILRTQPKLNKWIPKRFENQDNKYPKEQELRNSKSPVTFPIQSNNRNSPINQENSFPVKRKIFKALQSSQLNNWIFPLSKIQNNYRKSQLEIEDPRRVQFQAQNIINQRNPLSNYQTEKYLFENNQLNQNVLKTEHFQFPSNEIQELEPKGSYEPAEYQFNYFVHDEKTGDIKAQEETRNGDKLKGRYSLVQPDGLRRIVEYYDDSHGFNAHVKYVPVH